MTETATVEPLEKTFKALVDSGRPSAARAIAYGVLFSTGQARYLAVTAALRSQEHEALDAVVQVFHDIPGDLQTAAIATADSFLSILRSAIHSNDRQIRANTSDFLIRMDDARVAYLMADLLQDAVPDIRKKAQEGLLALAHNYHVMAAEVEKGLLTIARQALETKRYALLDALLTALRFYKSHERPEMIAALLSLDPRGDEVLIDILSNPMDRRRKIILDILDAASYPRAVAFLLTMLKSPKAASLAVEVLETRFDTEFVKALLSNPVLLTNARVVSALAQVQFVPWLRPGIQKVDSLPARLAARAVRFLLYTGANSVEKQTILGRLAASKNIGLASAAKFVLAAMERRIHVDKIDAGLVKIEEHCPSVASASGEPSTGALVSSKDASAGQKAAVPLSDETLFRNFINSVESLSKVEREGAVADFKATGVFLRELKKALADSEVDVILRAIKVVELTESNTDVTTELVLLTKHGDGRIRAGAVRQLGKSGAYDAMKTLFEALSDRDRRVLANAVEALEATGHKQILRLLEPLMAHPDNRVRANAAKAAWTLGSEGGRVVLIEMLKSPKSSMRLSGLWGLRQIGAKDQIPFIREISKTDAEERVRKSAELTVAELENVV